MLEKIENVVKIDIVPERFHYHFFFFLISRNGSISILFIRSFPGYLILYAERVRDGRS